MINGFHTTESAELGRADCSVDGGDGEAQEFDFAEPRCAETAHAPSWAWGIYLAVSWTWCIGMFLPAILVRDMGAWVLAVFAVPNIVGAGLVGWTDLADRLRRRHGGMVRAFSVVTIAFQSFFASVLISRLGPISGAGVMAGFVCVWGVMTLGRSPIRPTQVVFGVSMLAGLVLLWTLGGQLPASVRAETGDVVGGGEGVAAGSAGVIALVALAPVVAFGFLLCPPMDATFQHVRLQTRDRGGDAGGDRGGRRTRVAFTLGFGVFFPLLICASMRRAAM